MKLKELFNLAAELESIGCTISIYFFSSKSRVVVVTLNKYYCCNYKDDLKTDPKNDYYHIDDLLGIMRELKNNSIIKITNNQILN